MNTITPTKKLFLSSRFLTECTATITGITSTGIILDQTVAFPEGGGQEGDHGFIIIKHDEQKYTIPFFDTQKNIGDILVLPDFPAIQVNTPIAHKIDNNDLHYFKLGMQVTVTIDLDRRAKLTANHTGLHLVLMAIEQLRGKFSDKISGCHITPEYGRLDFVTEDKFTSDELIKIAEITNNLIVQNLPIKTYAHSQHHEAIFWQCGATIYPCGGTHLPSTKYLNNVVVKRKNLGKNLERIIAAFPNANLPSP